MTEETKVETAENSADETNANANASVQIPAFYGVKAGMTRVFDESGAHVPVTVVKLIPNYISQVKTKENDGYEAYQLAYFQKKDKLISKPRQGHLKKAKLNPNLARSVEVKVEGVDPAALGQEVSLDSFKEAQYVDVTSVSKGKGFQGVMKRHNFQGGPATHGSHFHRRVGSIGNRATPGRVFKQKKMPGHMGSKKHTVQNLKIVELNVAEGYLLLKGSVPGSKNSVVKVARAMKK